jgi:hypothetical protein
MASVRSREPPPEIAMLVLETEKGKLEYPDISDAFFA